ncbi:MAG: protein kinase domain-containing protein, partial [Thermogutta sp.]
MTKDGDVGEFGGMPDLAGRRIGDFDILRRIGAGAMAEVYQAEQLSLKRQVALKILRPELARDPTYVRRFRREAQAVARLVHPNIVQIFEVGNREDLHYIAVEYVPGLNLRQWLQKYGPPDLRSALIIMRQAAAGGGQAGGHPPRDRRRHRWRHLLAEID